MTPKEEERAELRATLQLVASLVEAMLRELYALEPQDKPDLVLILKRRTTGNVASISTLLNASQLGFLLGQVAKHCDDGGSVVEWPIPFDRVEH